MKTRRPVIVVVLVGLVLWLLKQPFPHPLVENGQTAIKGDVKVIDAKSDRLGMLVPSEPVENLELKESARLRNQKSAHFESGDTNSLDYLLTVLADSEASESFDRTRYDAAQKLRSLGLGASAAVRTFSEMLHSKDLITRWAGADALPFTSEATARRNFQYSARLGCRRVIVQSAQVFGERAAKAHSPA